MYQVSVGGPPDPLPHAARLDASTSAATAPMGPRRRAARPGEEPPTVRRTCTSGPQAWDTGIPSGAAPPGEDATLGAWPSAHLLSILNGTGLFRRYRTEILSALRTTAAGPGGSRLSPPRLPRPSRRASSPGGRTG